MIDNSVINTTGRSSWLGRMSFGYAGKTDVGVRKLMLVLDVPAPRAAPRQGRLQESFKTTSRSWHELANHPVQLLRKMEQFLKVINKQIIPAQQRSALVERALQYASPAIRKIYSAQYKAESLPESHDRREGLILAANVCHQLATGYKHQLMEDFALPDKAYLRVRERVRAHALRLFELVRVEQRLRAMRYQKLSRIAWMDCHRLYFALSQCEDVTACSPGLTCLQPLSEADSTASHGIYSRRPQPLISIQQTYLSINLFGLIDANAVSAQKMHVADLQLARVLDKLEISEDDGEALEDGQVIVYYGQDGPGYFLRQDDKAVAPPIQGMPLKGFWKKPLSGMQDPIANAAQQMLAKKIDLSPLTDVLAREVQQLIAHFEAEKPVSAGAVADKGDLARLLVLDTMHDRLRLKQRQQEREYVTGLESLRVYNGFMPAYKLLTDIQAGIAGSGQDLRDVLARQSALISADNDMHQFGQWLVVDKNAEAVRIKTHESPFTHSLYIGQMLAFSLSAEDTTKPDLGYVVRMSRSRDNEIEVTIRVLSQQPVATVAQNAYLTQNDLAMPAILLAGEADKQLVLHHSHRLAVNTPLQIDVAGELCKFTLSGISQLQREFIVYSLSDGHVTH